MNDPLRANNSKMGLEGMSKTTLINPNARAINAYDLLTCLSETYRARNSIILNRLPINKKMMTIIEEIANLWRRGYKSVCVAGYNAEGVLPNWHRVSDNLENIEPETLSRAACYVWELAREIDRA